MMNKHKGILTGVLLLCCFILGVITARFYQPRAKTFRIYKQALRDYNNGNYQNSYYLFSKISSTSKLKPAAIYRQSMCAKALGDKDSELKRYQSLFHNYPSDKLSLEAKYFAGQILIDDNPTLAKKYFEDVAKSEISQDYKIASEYYIARITAAKIRYSQKKEVTPEKFSQIETSFRNYLEKYPDGRLSVNVANNWLKFNPKINSKDLTLIAKAYLLANLPEDADKILAKTDIKDSWTVQVSNAILQKDKPKADSIIRQGVSKYSQNVDFKDYKMAVDDYLKNNENSIYSLFEISKGKGKDYLWKIKCENSPQNTKYSCYKDLYKNFPKGEFAADATENIFIEELARKDYDAVRITGKEFISKYPNSELLPLVYFWLGKVEQNYNSLESAKYLNILIKDYPDSYYAYRAFWIIKNISRDTIKANFDIKPVIYPYKFPSKKSILYILMMAEDYDMIAKYTNDDFISSWAQYQKGNYAQSMHIAQDAMAKIKNKPPKTDPRWRLVYPLNYYKQLQKYASQYGNNVALMISIAREESYFNSEAQSDAGAIGLMQLMPSTAHDIGSKNGMDFNTGYLLNPELNIKIGNLYYSTLRKSLSGKDMYAIAAYNGGAGSVEKWKSSLKYSDIDEFVLQIPYDETRNYVKKVFRTYWNYTRIYQKQ